ncbi:MAG: LemA family protein [Erysipelotrichaceae bacterium]|nr:MAG: LemA family [Erysipelotrichaceae bacterium]TXT19830.1 MAG: LemA family protein [Erysipelotrichaceae bacterium]
MEFILLGLLGVVAVGVMWVMGTYNSLITIRNKVEEAFSTMDVYLVKRYDLIPNLVETVKGYAKHERETLDAVIRARNAAKSSGTVEEKLANENVLAGTLGRLFALAEAYPDLKANSNFMDLQAQLKVLEEDVANARKYYNGAVRQYNTQIQVFPSNILANMFKFTKKPLFEVEEESQRKAVKVQF